MSQSGLFVVVARVYVYTQGYAADCRNLGKKVGESWKEYVDSTYL